MKKIEKGMAAPQTAARADNFYPDGKPISGPDVIARILKEPAGDTCLLAFSGGKDSVCAWLTLRQHFKRIVPFYLYRVPGLPYVDKMLADYEAFFGTHIYQYPNPDLYHYLKAMLWQAPQNCAVIEAADLPDPTYDMLTQILREELKLPNETFCATGVRAVDNIERGMAVRKHGPINWLRKNFWPVWDMKKADVFTFLKASGVKLSVEYHWFGHSLGGMDYRYLKGIHDNSPADWAVILKWFPLAYLELARYDTIGDWKNAHSESTARQDQSQDNGSSPAEFDLEAGDDEPDPFAE